MLIFEPEWPAGRWSSVTDEEVVNSPDPADPDAWIRQVVAADSPAAIVYLLQHGGETIRSPFARFSPDLVEAVSNCSPFWGAENERTLAAARHWQSQLPQIPHLLACDTAFFADLPEAASTYALPADLRSSGLRRYGSDGFCHVWIWRQAVRYSGGRARRVVGVHLAGRPTCAALLDGRPLDVSGGLTPVEGLLSTDASGDVDPSVGLILRAAGFTPADIARALAEESGFAALLGRRCTIHDVLAEPGPDAELGRQILRHGLLEKIGACLAVLGGADLLVFGNEAAAPGQAYLTSIVHDLAFLGVSLHSPNGPEIPGVESPGTGRAAGPEAVILPYLPEAVLAKMAAEFLEHGENA